MGTEHAVVFECEGAQLAGVLHEPDAPRGDRGVLIVVGGPQYRVGSHRQFVLLARALAERGIAALRFDHRGVGDSDGDSRSFTDIDADIDAAVRFFLERVSSVRSIVIWGLCDAASAALMYAHRDGRIKGLVLLNPWVRDPELQARAYLRGYYLRQLFDAAFWRRLLRGEVAVLRSLREVAENVRLASSAKDSAPAQERGRERSFVERMLEGLQRFHGPVALILSGDDLTADEFRELVRGSRAWRRSLDTAPITRHEFAEANHTFSRATWRDQVARWTETWLRSW